MAGEDAVGLDIWSGIAQLTGSTIKTVTGRGTFTVLSVSDRFCELKVHSTGKVRRIPRREFESAASLGSASSKSTADIRQSGASEYNPAYVLAVLRTIEQA